jgi:hypothetical protein
MHSEEEVQIASALQRAEHDSSFAGISADTPSGMTIDAALQSMRCTTSPIMHC